LLFLLYSLYKRQSTKTETFLIRSRCSKRDNVLSSSKTPYCHPFVRTTVRDVIQNTRTHLLLLPPKIRIPNKKSNNSLRRTASHILQCEGVACLSFTLLLPRHAPAVAAPLVVRLPTTATQHDNERRLSILRLIKASTNVAFMSTWVLHLLSDFCRCARRPRGDKKFFALCLAGKV
jgi:hypothetical protein